VIAEDHTLRVEDHLRVLLRSAGVYSPRRKFARPLLGRSGLEANVEVVKETALEYGNMGGLGKLLDLLGPGAARPGELNIFAASAVDRLVLLEEALYSGKEDELTGAVRGLIGLGLGLTPSSDDMLAGMVLLCVLSQVNGGRRQDACRLLAKVTAAAAPGRTTSLSAEYLRSAASGRGNERLTRLCASVLTGERDAVERETMRVLEIGETSGTDMVLGIVLGTMFCAGRRLALVRRRP